MLSEGQGGGAGTYPAVLKALGSIPSLENKAAEPRFYLRASLASGLLKAWPGQAEQHIPGVLSKSLVQVRSDTEVGCTRLLR